MLSYNNVEHKQFVDNELFKLSLYTCFKLRLSFVELLIEKKILVSNLCLFIVYLSFAAK